MTTCVYKCGNAVAKKPTVGVRYLPLSLALERKIYCMATRKTTNKHHNLSRHHRASHILPEILTLSQVSNWQFRNEHLSSGFISNDLV